MHTRLGHNCYFAVCIIARTVSLTLYQGLSRKRRKERQVAHEARSRPCRRAQRPWPNAVRGWPVAETKSLNILPHISEHAHINFRWNKALGILLPTAQTAFQDHAQTVATFLQTVEKSTTITSTMGVWWQMGVGTTRFQQSATTDARTGEKETLNMNAVGNNANKTTK